MQTVYGYLYVTKLVNYSDVVVVAEVSVHERPRALRPDVLDYVQVLGQACKNILFVMYKCGESSSR